MGADDRFWIKRTRLFQIDQGTLNIRPAGILRQDRADHYLEWGVRRPPMPGTIVIEKVLVDALNND